MIIQLLYPLIFAEMALVLTLSFRTPIRVFLIKGLDHLKHGSRGTVVAKTIAGTLVVVFVSSLYGLTKVRKLASQGGGLNPTDEVLMAFHLLEASLLGFSLFLGLMIDRLHYYIRDIQHLRKKLLESQHHLNELRSEHKELHALGDKNNTISRGNGRQLGDST